LARKTTSDGPPKFAKNALFTLKIATEGKSTGVLTPKTPHVAKN